MLVEEKAARATAGHPVFGFNPRYLHYHFHLLYSWDTSWYLSLARHGYLGNPHQAIRFFPLLPLTARMVAAVGIPAATAILLVCWSAALGSAILLHRLVLSETGSPQTALRAAWLSQLAPGAFVLVMGYSEALSGLVAVGYVLAVRQYGRDARRAWLWCAAGCLCGFASGLARPTGFTVAVVGAIEICMRLVARERITPAAWVARLAMTLSPLLGVGSFLWWSRSVEGSFLLPYSEQTIKGLRSTVASNPVIPAWHVFAYPTAHGELGGTGMMTLVLIVASVGLLWACLRRLPVSFTAFAALSLASAITAPYFSSFARYTSENFPLAIAAATLPRSRSAWLWTIGASAAMCAFFAYRALMGTYTP